MATVMTIRAIEEGPSITVSLTALFLLSAKMGFSQSRSLEIDTSKVGRNHSRQDEGAPGHTRLRRHTIASCV